MPSKFDSVAPAAIALARFETPTPPLRRHTPFSQDFIQTRYPRRLVARYDKAIGERQRENDRNFAGRADHFASRRELIV
jgi:hypothetical protein